MLRVKLSYLNKEITHRREIAKYYIENIKNKKIILPIVHKEDNHVWHLFVIKSDTRDDLKQYLERNGIQTLIHYPIAPSKQEAYKELNTEVYEITEIIHNQALSLHLSGIQNIESTKTIVKVINEYK